MKISLQSIIETLKQAGYRDVVARKIPVERFKPVKRNDPKRGEFTELAPDHTTRTDIFCTPDSLLDSGTKNFACLAVMDRIGAKFEGHHTYAGVSILRDVDADEGNDEPKKAEGAKG